MAMNGRTCTNKDNTSRPETTRAAGAFRAKYAARPAAAQNTTDPAECAAPGRHEQVARYNRDMSRVASEPDLWTLTSGRPQIDPAELAEAVRRQVGESPLDFRTRLLVRDSLDALARHWGRDRVATWLTALPNRSAVERLWQSDLGPPGFPSLSDRLMDTTKPETVLQFLREVGVSLHRPLSVSVGGSASLIVTGRLSRATEAVDLADEVPAEIRNQHELLDRLAKRYGLHIAHFQSHCLPTGWVNRVQSLGRLGQLEVRLADVYDIFLGKLFSRREKDRDDLRALAAQLDRKTLIERLRNTTAPLRSEEPLRQAAADNWYILFGAPLPW